MTTNHNISNIDVVKKFYNEHKEFLAIEKSIKKVYNKYKEYIIQKYPLNLLNEYIFRTHLIKNGYCNSCGSLKKCKKCIKLSGVLL
jgi:hypothetical protein